MLISITLVINIVWYSFGYLGFGLFVIDKEFFVMVWFWDGSE